MFVVSNFRRWSGATKIKQREIKIIRGENFPIYSIRTNMYVFGHYTCQDTLTDQNSIYTYFTSISMALKRKLKGEGGSIHVSQYIE